VCYACSVHCVVRAWFIGLRFNNDASCVRVMLQCVVYVHYGMLSFGSWLYASVCVCAMCVCAISARAMFMCLC